MSTTTLPRPTTLQRVHSTILGKTRFYCIQPNCDGTHHVWCRCARSHAS